MSDRRIRQLERDALVDEDARRELAEVRARAGDEVLLPAVVQDWSRWDSFAIPYRSASWPLWGGLVTVDTVHGIRYQPTAWVSASGFRFDVTDGLTVTASEGGRVLQIEGDPVVADRYYSAWWADWRSAVPLHSQPRIGMGVHSEAQNSDKRAGPRGAGTPQEP